MTSYFHALRELFSDKMMSKSHFAPHNYERFFELVLNNCSWQMMTPHCLILALLCTILTIHRLSEPLMLTEPRV